MHHEHWRTYLHWMESQFIFSLSNTTFQCSSLLHMRCHTYETCERCMRSVEERKEQMLWRISTGSCPNPLSSTISMVSPSSATLAPSYFRCLAISFWILSTLNKEERVSIQQSQT